MYSAGRPRGLFAFPASGFWLLVPPL